MIFFLFPKLKIRRTIRLNNAEGYTVNRKPADMYWMPKGLFFYFEEILFFIFFLLWQMQL